MHILKTQQSAILKQKRKTKTQKFLEQFGLEVLSSDKQSDLEVEASVTKASLLKFSASLKTNELFGEFKFKLVGTRFIGLTSVCYAIYPKNFANERKLGWMTFIIAPASTKAIVVLQDNK